MEIDFDEIYRELKRYNDNFLAVEVNINDIVFEKRMKLNCFYCGRYNNCFTCPPKIPDIDYSIMFKEFDKALFVYLILPFDDDTYSSVRNDSSVLVHKTLLHLEKYLLDQGNSTYLSFIGGSCKLCKSGCNNEKCNNPYNARIPVEATGVNVTKTLEKYGVSIKFPVKNSITRAGLLLW